MGSSRQPFNANYAFEAVIEGNRRGPESYEQILDNLAGEALVYDIAHTISLLIAKTPDSSLWLRAVVAPFFRDYSPLETEGQYALGSILGIFLGLNDLRMQGQRTKLAEEWPVILAKLLSQRTGLIKLANPAMVPEACRDYTPQLSAAVKEFAGLENFHLVQQVLKDVLAGSKWDESARPRPSPVVLEVINSMCFEMFKRVGEKERLKAIANAWV